MSARFMKAPGSPSEQLQITYLGVPAAPRQICHFRQVGKPAPPRPRSPASLTRPMTSSGVMPSAWFSPA